MRQKQLEIEEFSVYWDTKSTMLGDLPQAQIQVVMFTDLKTISVHVVPEITFCNILLFLFCKVVLEISLK